MHRLYWGVINSIFIHNLKLKPESPSITIPFSAFCRWNAFPFCSTLSYHFLVCRWQYVYRNYWFINHYKICKRIAAIHSAGLAQVCRAGKSEEYLCLIIKRKENEYQIQIPWARPALLCVLCSARDYYGMKGMIDIIMMEDITV